MQSPSQKQEIFNMQMLVVQESFLSGSGNQKMVSGSLEMFFPSPFFHSILQFSFKVFQVFRGLPRRIETTVITGEVGKFYCRSLGSGHPNRNTDSSGTHAVRSIARATFGAGPTGHRFNAVGGRIAIFKYSLDRQFPTVKRMKPIVDRNNRTHGILCGFASIPIVIF